MKILGQVPSREDFCCDWDCESKTTVSLDLWFGQTEIYSRTEYQNEGMPEDVFLGRRMRFDFEPGTRRDWVVKMLADGGAINELCARIHAGFTVENDNGRERGRLTPDAYESALELETLLRHAPKEVVYTIEWAMGYDGMSYAKILEVHGLTLDSSDEAVQSAADEAFTSCREVTEDDAVLMFDAADIEYNLRLIISTLSTKANC